MYKAWPVPEQELSATQAPPRLWAPRALRRVLLCGVGGGTRTAHPAKGGHRGPSRCAVRVGRVCGRVARWSGGPAPLPRAQPGTQGRCVEHKQL